ncbi:AAA family ATPase [Halothermothrix orenii]|uniref:Nuclease SbcCD subunit C n=1 Tax=Halothermothrix orenii (strain H 168 / OCM 544 / DSM 9562) TaxID=373903 RepID=B8D1T5_HALOH|nr:AAA family ATPase [Halothermothrix orenii]ACL69162.1 Exodeoxyribonuclease I subunit C [Halothermothrix orenii H 168]
MRPLLLKISGLNSFVQEEIINFKKLTEKGLFGIFGPTGSGKSSILDAITIALYGKIARDTKEFINKETGELYVYFEFAMGSNQKTYCIDRKLKTSDNNGYTTSRVRLAIKENGKVEEVYEKVREVEDKVEKIIGLNHEDFMRTVVLPQGQFSEFLTLQGKKRRDMLERILNLEEFGERLMEKLRLRKNIKESQLKSVETILTSYEDVSEKSLEDILNKLENLKKEIGYKKKRLQEKRNEYEKYKEVWTRQKQLLKYQEKLDTLEERSERISNLKNKMEQAKKALNLKKDINRLERYHQERKETNQKVENLEKMIVDLREKRDRYNREYEESLRAKEKELPDLTKKKLEIKDAIKLYEQNKGIKKEVTGKAEKLKQMVQDKNSLEEYLKRGQEKSRVIKQQIKDLEDIIEKQVINSDYRKTIMAGLNLERDYKQVQKDIKVINQGIKRLEREIWSLDEKRKDKSGELKRIESGILYQYEKIIGDKEKAERELNGQKEKLEDDINKKRKQLEDLEKEIEDYKIRNLAGILAGKLTEGSPCPVCGSTEHPRVAEKIDKAGLQKLLNTRKEIDSKLTELEERLNKYNSGMSILNKELTRLRQEKEEVILSFDNVLSELEEYDGVLTTGPGELRRKRDRVKNELTKYTTQLETKQKDLADRKDKMKELKSLNSTLKQEYFKLIGELGIDDIADELENINKKDKERENYQKRLTQLRQQYEKINNRIENYRVSFNETEREITIFEHKIQTLKDKYQENRKEIENKVGDRDPLHYLKEVESREEELKKRVDKYKKALEDTTDLLNNKERLMERLKQNRATLIKEISDTEQYLKEKMDEYKFESFDDVRKYLSWENQIRAWEEEITEFEDLKKEVESNITRLKMELNGQSISQERWTKIKADRESLEENLSRLQEELGSCKQTIEELKRKLELKRKNQEKKEELEHDLAVIKDINDLIRGKSFVEFVAMKQLRYIALEASSRLMEITNNRYKLELDNQGEFVICDNYNGGVRRDCKTLSGGETFLTSLSLALSLSSHIQLKGNSNMEFFFLDEGFGTLDVNLLDIVMNSLERLHNEHLTVGIISHVEELKNRVPVKLMVEPAEPGLHGSRVRIEYT